MPEQTCEARTQSFNRFASDYSEPTDTTQRPNRRLVGLAAVVAGSGIAYFASIRLQLYWLTAVSFVVSLAASGTIIWITRRKTKRPFNSLYS
jgi:hypothetical protein